MSLENEYFYFSLGIPRGPFEWPDFVALAKKGTIKANTKCMVNDAPSRLAKDFFGQHWDQIQAIQDDAKAKIAEEKTLRIQEKKKIKAAKQAKKIPVVPPVPSPQAHESKSEMNPNLMDCPDCGSTVSKRANACPNCGCPIVERQTDVLVPGSRLIGHPMRSVQTPAQQPTVMQVTSVNNTMPNYGPRQSKGVAVVLALLVGGIGVHHFYMGRSMRGLLYLLFCWTFIPAILSLLEAVYYALMSNASFQSRCY
jgi:hypothetical protein